MHVIIVGAFVSGDPGHTLGLPIAYSGVSSGETVRRRISEGTMSWTDRHQAQTHADDCSQRHLGHYLRCAVPRA
jgi:hypothetical protein